MLFTLIDHGLTKQPTNSIIAKEVEDEGKVPVRVVCLLSDSSSGLDDVGSGT